MEILQNMTKFFKIKTQKFETQFNSNILCIYVNGVFLSECVGKPEHIVFKVIK